MHQKGPAKAALSLTRVPSSTMQGPAVLLDGKQVLCSKICGPLPCRCASPEQLVWL